MAYLIDVVISCALVLLCLANWWAVGLLAGARRREDGTALKDMSRRFRLTALASTAWGVLSANFLVSNGTSILPPGVRLTILLIGALLVSGPTLYFLWTWYLRPWERPAA